MWKMGYLTVLHVRLGAKIWDLHARDSSSFCNRLIEWCRARREENSYFGDHGEVSRYISAG